MEYATGKYLYFLDGDDILDINFLEQVVAEAERLAADIVVFDFYKMDNTTKKLEYRNGLNRNQFPKDKDYFNYKDVPNNILRIVNPTPWNKLYNTEYIRKTGLKYLSLSSTNDITFASLSVAMANKIGYVPKAFLYYRINLKASITSAKQKKLDNVITAVLSTKEQAMQLDYSEEISNSIKSFMVDNLTFALNNYAGDRNNPYYRTYYAKLHKMFNEPFFSDVTLEKMGNKKIYENFIAIKENPYSKVFVKSLMYGETNKPLSKFAKLLKSNKYTMYLYKFLVAFRDEGFSFAVNKSCDFIKNKLQTNKMIKENSVKTVEEKIRVEEKIVIKEITSVTPQVTKQFRRKKIIVSMTSYPARINAIRPSIESLLAQSLKPDMIILWLAEEQFPEKENDLPNELLKLKEYGLTINWCSDLRSYKKLIPALETYPEDIIITVDDDLLYDEFMLEKLYLSYQKYPNAISCVRVHLMQYDEQGNLLPYKEWVKENSDYVAEPRMDLFCTTGAGTLFPPHILPDEVKNIDVFMNDCRNADDIWVNVMASMKKVPVVLVDKQKNLRYAPETQGQCLWHDNVDGGGNDKQLQTILQRYNLTLCKE